MTPINPTRYGSLYRLGSCFSGKLELFKAELTDIDGFDECFKGCSTVHHIASPFNVWEKDPFKEIVTPAIEGTTNVMAAAKRAGVKRVVLTSSVFAIGNFMHPDPPVNGTIYTEEDWNTQASKSAHRSTTYMRSKPLTFAVCANEAQQQSSQDGTHTDIVMLTCALAFPC